MRMLCRWAKHSALHFGMWDMTILQWLYAASMLCIFLAEGLLILVWVCVYVCTSLSELNSVMGFGRASAGGCGDRSARQLREHMFSCGRTRTFVCSNSGIFDGRRWFKAERSNNKILNELRQNRWQGFDLSAYVRMNNYQHQANECGSHSDTIRFVRWDRVVFVINITTI